MSRATGLSGYVFALVGVALAAGAIALPVWWLANPPQDSPPAELPLAAESAYPDQLILLPETPLENNSDNPPDLLLPPEPQATLPQQDAQTTQDPPLPPETLIIPAIDLNASIVPVGWTEIMVGGQLYGQWQVPYQKAVGWHNASAGIGQAGNTVLNGHHNRYGEVFRNLVDLEVGDEVWLVEGGNLLTYAVSETLILPEKYETAEVRLANAQYILPTSGERVTLVTCWPYSGNTHRLIVVALPTNPPDIDASGGVN